MRGLAGKWQRVDGGPAWLTLAQKKMVGPQTSAAQPKQAIQIVPEKRFLRVDQQSNPSG